MDFLDSLDLDASKYKKSRRVRSWYLYEQYKSLENNQLDAARKLKSRSYQDRILRQELSERRARRKLCDQFGNSQSECGIENKSTKTSLDVGTDDLYKSFHELQDEAINTSVSFFEDAADVESQRNSLELSSDDFKDSDDQNDVQSRAESPNSVINIKSEETLTESYIEIEKKPKYQNMELDLDDVRQKLQCLERLAQMGDFDKFSENEGSLYSIEEEELKQIIMQDKNVDTPENNIYLMWTKLVSFAFQIMELNHGNCYYDYGSQFLTAVLACDVLRRGINRMCHILQPYVSPLKYATDSDSDISNKKVERKRHRRCCRKNSCYKRHFSHKNSKKMLNTNRYDWASFRVISSPYPKEIIGLRNYLASEPCPRTCKLTTIKRNPTTKLSYHDIWPCRTSDNCSSKSVPVNTCSSCRKVVNPMLHLSLYLDKIIKHANDHVI